MSGPDTGGPPSGPGLRFRIAMRELGAFVFGFLAAWMFLAFAVAVLVPDTAWVILLPASLLAVGYVASLLYRRWAR